MHGLAPYLAGGLAAVLAMDFLPVVPAAYAPARDAIATASDAPVNVVDRSHKGDRLPLRRGSGPKVSVGAVEIVGLRDTAIVYRDRDGRVLYRTEPLSNATVVARDIALPDVTIRDGAGTTVRMVPVEVYRRAPEPAKPPAGCEPPFSPLSAATGGAVGRCFAQQTGTARLAALDH